MKVSNTEQIPAIFVMANFEKDQLWRGHSIDLVAFLYQFDNSRWRKHQLPEGFEESNELVYWKNVTPATLQQEFSNLKALTNQELIKLIDDFNPEWEDFYDNLLPGILKCPNCGEKLPAHQHSVLTTN